MEIDVSKCAFYNNGKCNNPNGMACNCCNNTYCYYKEIQQLKAENESYEYQLQKRIEICDSWMGVANKYKQCLDEIEGIAQKMPLTSYYKKQILQKIKQAKEGGE